MIEISKVIHTFTFATTKLKCLVWESVSHIDVLKRNEYLGYVRRWHPIQLLTGDTGKTFQAFFGIHIFRPTEHE